MPAKERLAPCIVIGGPTASGKSALAEKMSQELDGVIINGDSMQVYKGMRIITAQPEPDDHHRLYGILDPSEICSAARWREMAILEIEKAFAQGHQPIIVGGTGLYLRALVEGLSFIPDIPVDIRKKVRTLWEKGDPEVFYNELKKVDPESASSLNGKDKQRLMRAMEVQLATGKPIKEWRREAKTQLPPYTFHKILVLPPKRILDDRIAMRFEDMLTHGVIEEVRALKSLPTGSPAAKAIGVPELLQYLEGVLSLEEAKERAIISSRQLAKRQSTWFRHQFNPDQTIDHVTQVES